MMNIAVRVQSMLAAGLLAAGSVMAAQAAGAYQINATPQPPTRAAQPSNISAIGSAMLNQTGSQ